ncbi:MAG: sugar phosphate isomerase/epimerase family protein [Anaerolineales bacterium]|nr:sugar phosphate isomerase/epimerase [Anaerolineales bacterium]MDW8447203.1 sugar phosphate isomerase/epimerase family protein [Anaerolineales bacterium]
MKYSVSNWIYGDEPLEKTFERLSRFGYDGIELMGEPRLYDPAEVKRHCQKYNLRVLSIAGMYPWPTQERDLANPDPGVRARAVNYLKECVDFAEAVEAPVIIVVPSAVAKTSPVGDPKDEEEWIAASEREWKWAVNSVGEAAAYAAQKGISLAIEPINRYETYLINTCEQALRFVEEVNNKFVGIHLDTFHMNIEEPDPPGAIRMAGEKLLNVHIADSNRQSVGRGHIDFKTILKALLEINYPGALALEPLPPVPDPYIAIRLKRFSHLRDVFAQESINRLREIAEELRREAYE